MSILDFTPSSLAAYSNPPNNYVGTTLFLTYILLALYLTVFIITSLSLQYHEYISNPTSTSTKDSTKNAEARSARARHIQIYAFLASISFSLLSYHMLNFLISSYLHWSGETHVTTANVSEKSLKKWMLESSLFESFARELVGDGPSVVWTQIAILGTWFWGVWMGQKGMLWLLMGCLYDRDADIVVYSKRERLIMGANTTIHPPRSSIAYIFYGHAFHHAAASFIAGSDS